MERITKNEEGRRIGECHPRCRYSESMIRTVFFLQEAGATRKVISDVLGMPYSTVRSIVTGRTRCQTMSVQGGV